MGSLGSTVGEVVGPLAGSGSGVRIGLIDTGVDTSHQDLTGKVVANYEVVIGYCEPFVERVEVGRDNNQHGTACAGILSEIAPGAEIHSVQVIGDQ